jgi:protoporphyrinogen oxidase
MNRKKAIIIGAGPAGLTAAYELIERTDIVPIVYEMTDSVGGISKTVNYKGNRIDIGGHRFFSKSDRVMQWWLDILPIQSGYPASGSTAPDPDVADQVMLVRNRLSRILFLGKFFDYPLQLSIATLSKLGVTRIFKIGLSYLETHLFPIKEEKSLEDFFTNRFGKELYSTFFRDYTQKVWGVPCSEIKPEWGAQRVKGLSVSKAVFHALSRLFRKDSSIAQKNVETSLIEQFLYPKFGPGQIWEEVSRRIVERGGEIHLNSRIMGMDCNEHRVSGVRVRNEISGALEEKKGDYFFSTMPVKDLIQAMGGSVPPAVKDIAEGLSYRDFITVGLLLRKLKVKNQTQIQASNGLIPDNWIYVQETSVKLGRIQIFNNWSPYMVADKETVWVGLEYFCNEGDDLWGRTDQEMADLAVAELARIGFIEGSSVLDHTVIRMPKTYPGYFGTYEHFARIREFTDPFQNLYLIGRNGMHRYNNQDHSMLTAMTAVDNILAGIKSKDPIWDINIEEDYHEEKKPA